MVFQMLALGPHSSQKSESNVDNDDEEDVDEDEDEEDEDPDDRSWRVLGTVEVSFDKVVCPVPADVASAWVTAAD